DATNLPPNTGNIRNEHEQTRPEARRDRPRRGVAVDVKDLSGRAIQRGRRDDRNPARVDELLEERAVDEADATHETELGILPLRAEDPAVDPGQADRGYTASEKRGDNAPVRKPAEHR